MLDRVCRVDDDGLVGLLVAYQVGGTAEIFVHELPEEHLATLAPATAISLEVKT